MGSHNRNNHSNTRGICLDIYGVVVKEDNTRTGRRNIHKK